MINIKAVYKIVMSGLFFGGILLLLGIGAIVCIMVFVSVVDPETVIVNNALLLKLRYFACAFFVGGFIAGSLDEIRHPSYLLFIKKKK